MDIEDDHTARIETLVLIEVDVRIALIGIQIGMIIIILLMEEVMDQDPIALIANLKAL